MIHICYGLYDRDGRYSKFVGTSMASVFENTMQSVTVHILHDNTLSVENRDRFIYLTGRYGQRVEFYNVEQLAAEQIEGFRSNLPSILKSQYSIATLYRLLIPRLMESLTKIIYLDADILVNRDIVDLWSIRLNDQPLAAMPECAGGVLPVSDKYLITSETIKGEDYMNAGVLLLDLNYFREHESEIWEDGYAFVAAHPECKYFDQDILNYCYSTRYVKLTADFNRFVDVERLLRAPVTVKPHIYHFLSHSLHLDLSDCLNRLYFEYFVKTPWFNVEIFGGIFDGINRLIDREKYRLIQMTSLLGTKRRAFFAEPENYAIIQEIFGTDKDEPTYNSSVENSLERLIDEMKQDGGQHLFIILVAGFEIVRYHLRRNDFVEGRDFINGVELLPSVYGFPANTKPIVAAL